MEFTLAVYGLIPRVSFRSGRIVFDLAWPHLQVGSHAFTLERTGHRPGGGWYEVWKESGRLTHVFAFGRRLMIERTR